MNDKFFSSLNNLLADGRLAHVIDVLTRKCQAGAEAHPDLRNLIPSLERIADTYSHMREYLLSGTPDPDRERIYTSLTNHLREIARDYLFIINEDRLDPFFADYRLQKVRGRSVADLADEISKAEYRVTMASVTEADASQFVKKREEAVGALFLKIWSLPPWADEDRQTIRKLLEESAFEVQSQIVSALLLGLLKFYDPGKFMLLLEAYGNFADERLAARALTAIVLVLSRHGNSVLYDLPVVEALNNLSDSILTYTRLRDVVMTLIRTRDTDRVSREVNDAFKTTMKHIDPDILEKMSREGIVLDSAETDMNPEWEKMMQNKELEEKMQLINDMQLEGMDVMMQTFARLKSFPFFNSLPNWFLPFSTSHSAVATLFENFDKEAFAAMGEATDMCASDRYSFAMGILQMPEERRNMLNAALGGQLDSVRDLLKDRENVRRKPVFASECLIFDRDLYRFAKVFPKRRDFFDPFAEPYDFLRLPVLGSLLGEQEIMAAMADFYFEHGYYSLALPIYEKIVTQNGGDRSLFEKIGYCHQMEGDFNSALENYEKADLFSSDADLSSTWLLKKLALCNKALGYYGKAAECYEKLLERNPNDLNTEFHLGSVLLRAGNVEKAKELLFKVQYINPEHKVCRRVCTRIAAHEAFLAGNFREAEKLYSEARGDQPGTDYNRHIMAELSLFGKDFDSQTLQILLDRGD